jgi:hypothetical protein
MYMKISQDYSDSIVDCVYSSRKYVNGLLIYLSARSFRITQYKLLITPRVCILYSIWFTFFTKTNAKTNTLIRTFYETILSSFKNTYT